MQALLGYTFYSLFFSPIFSFVFTICIISILYIFIYIYILYSYILLQLKQSLFVVAAVLIGWARSTHCLWVHCTWAKQTQHNSLSWLPHPPSCREKGYLAFKVENSEAEREEKRG